MAFNPFKKLNLRNNNHKKKVVEKKRERLKKEKEKKEKTKIKIPIPESAYYHINLIVLAFFVFLTIFIVVEVFIASAQPHWFAQSIGIYLVPIIVKEEFSAILGISAFLSGIDAVLHYYDTKRNLMISFFPTGVMLGGLGLYYYYFNGPIHLIVLVFTAIILFLDILSVLIYPLVLEDPGRTSLETYLVEQEEREEIKSELEKKIAEEEEQLKLRDQEIEKLKTEYETKSKDWEEEEERLKLKEQELEALRKEYIKAREEWEEEEERLKLKEQELLQLEKKLEAGVEGILAEEEEKLRMKEEELIRLQNSYEIERKMHEEARDQLSTIKAELEKQIRLKVEEEESLRIRREATQLLKKAKVKRVLYPFSAVVGQETMKKALILNAINPDIGGVLIKGQKGTGKSVTVRGLIEILPELEVIEECRFNCDPNDLENLCPECKLRVERNELMKTKRSIKVVDLPLNTTEDRLIGTIDIEKILHEGTKAFEPGILADVHRGILYVDEINLLDDYIVDILLDSAAMGIVNVEREGLSISYLSKFIIVGSMNPEEGELRPQLLDRLALQIDVSGLEKLEERLEIVSRREEFTVDPEGFRKKFEPEQHRLKEKIILARQLLPSVTINTKFLQIISQLCADFNVHGHRADIIIERTAKANAAYEGRTEVNTEDIVFAALLALPHRARKIPIEGEELTAELLRKLIKKYSQ